MGRRKKTKPGPKSRTLRKRKVSKESAKFIINTKLRKAQEFHQIGELEKAEQIYKEILRIDSSHSPSLALIGLIAQERGRHDKAEEFINKAIENEPDNPFHWNNLGYVLQRQTKLSEAIFCFKKSIELEPGHADAYCNLGFCFAQQRKPEEAIAYYQKVLKIDPNFTNVYFPMGMVFQDLGRPADAIACYQKALEINPNIASLHYNMGYALVQQGRLDEAIYYYQKAVQLRPDDAAAYCNMGLAFQYQGNPEKAIDAYKRSLGIKSTPPVYGNLLFQLQLTCAWKEIEKIAEKIDIATSEALENQTRTPESPFVCLTRHIDLSRNLAVAKSWSLHITRHASRLEPGFSFDAKIKRKILVGYLSGDFRDHAVAHLIGGLFELHNKNQFDIFCYSYREDDESQFRARIQKGCNKFVDLSALNDLEAAQCIHEDGVDILVDLAGHTEGNRLEICALRPAPVQVAFLGFPGTTGAEFIDYIIVDRIITPEHHAHFYTEKFVYMPHCFMVSDYAQPISNRIWDKADFGLLENSFVFCSFNAPYKIEPVMFDVWMNIIQQVPDSLLWLALDNNTAERNLRHEAESRGVNPERLVFSKNRPLEEHLKRLRLADLALDTRVYNGGATTSNALWACVPVVTLQGNHFASRMSSSNLKAIGLSQLVTTSLESYEKLAVYLACNPDKLKTIRQKLEANKFTEPLFETPRFVKNLENAYTEMWKIFLAGKRPRQIEVIEA